MLATAFSAVLLYGAMGAGDIGWDSTPTGVSSGLVQADGDIGWDIAPTKAEA
ncbi:hypothetical protein ACWD0A_31730 [Streptomyces sp. NPDC002867]